MGVAGIAIRTVHIYSPQVGDIQCMRSANHAAWHFEFCANGAGKAMLFLWH